MRQDKTIRSLRTGKEDAKTFFIEGCPRLCSPGIKHNWGDLHFRIFWKKCLWDQHLSGNKRSRIGWREVWNSEATLTNSTSPVRPGTGMELLACPVFRQGGLGFHTPTCSSFWIQFIIKENMWFWIRLLSLFGWKKYLEQDSTGTANITGSWSNNTSWRVEAERHATTSITQMMW